MPRAWIYVLLIAAAAAILSWGIEETHLRVSDPVLHFKREKGMNFATITGVLRQEILDATTRTAMLSYGGMGALLGLGLGMTGGRNRGSWGPRAAAGLAGLIVGATSGALLAMVLVPRYYNAVALNREAVEDDLGFPFMTHVGLWIGAGLAGGVGLGLALRSWRIGALAILGGVIGVVVGTAVYEFLGAVVFPMAETNLPVSKEIGSRLLAHLSVAVAAALGAWGVSSSFQASRDGPATAASLRIEGA